MVVAVFDLIFNTITKVVEEFLVSLNVAPTSYIGFFPSELDVVKFQKMLDDNVFPTISGLAPAITNAILLSIARLILHRILFEPMAMYVMNIREKPQEKCAQIDKLLPKKLKSIEKLDLSKISAESKLEEEFVSKYVWLKLRNDKVRQKTSKFCEAFWRLVFYTYFVCVGYYTLFTPRMMPWMIHDTKQNWLEWPFHPMSDMLKFYYMVELGCYLHQLMWTEVQRSDTLEMMLHHLVTILLLISSYLTNFTRIGASILMLHDVADGFLEGAKVFNYMATNNKNLKWCSRICDTLFVLFAVTFAVTRLYVYPRYILYTVIIEATAIYGMEWIGSYIFIGLLLILQFLHIFWFYLIMRMVFRLLSPKGIEGDVRSDDEEDVPLEDEYKPIAKKKTNNNNNKNGEEPKKNK